MRSNFTFHRIVYLLIGLSPINVLCDDTPTTLKVVMLTDYTRFSETILPAFSIAIKEAAKNLSCTVDQHPVNTMGSKTRVTRAYFDAEKHVEPHLYIGQKDSAVVRTMATLAGSKNRMYISLGGSVEQFALHQDSFPTFSSSGRGTHLLAELVPKVMQTYNWTRAVVVSALAEIYTLQAGYVRDAIKEAGMKSFPYSHAESNETEQDFNPRKNSVNIMFNHLKERACFIILLMTTKEARLVLKYAAEMGLMNGEYAFLVHAAIENIGVEMQDYDCFDGVLTVDRPIYEDTKVWRDFESAVQQENKDHPQTTAPLPASSSNSSNSGNADQIVNQAQQHARWKMDMKYAGLMYDAVIMWIEVMRKHKGQQLADVSMNGTKLASEFRDLRTYGVTGTIRMRNGMRLANYTLSMIQRAGNKEMLRFEADSMTFTDLHVEPQSLTWPGGGHIPPKEKCYEDCDDDLWKKLILIICGSIGSIVAIAVISYAVAMLVARSQEKQAIARWRIKWNEVQVVEDITEKNLSQSNDSEQMRDIRNRRISLLPRVSKPVGIYRGKSISIKKVNRPSVDIFEFTVYTELKQILHLKHDNINQFVGVCVDAPDVCVAMAYAEKGSLRDVLDDTHFEIDWQFHISLAMDIATGMEYLHSTPVGAHGHLTSLNCVIDERWVCKITDYGLQMFRCLDKFHRPLIELLWTSPEVLHKKDGESGKFTGTKPGDVFSFGIIISELLTREFPYRGVFKQGKLEELFAKIKLHLEPPFRPALPTSEEHLSVEWIELAKKCWQTSSAKRPTFKAIRTLLTETYSGKFTNVFERTQMILEDSLELASNELNAERRKTINLLQSIVPSTILKAVNDGVAVEPQFIKLATICQCDSHGIYEATKQIPVEVVVDALKSMYRKYDEIISIYGAYEVATWGSKDSMLLAGGLPINSSTSTQAICALSLELMKFVEAFSHPFVPPKAIKMRISIHTGSVYTSVMGAELPQLRVYGEAVNQTTYMHAFTKDGTIRISKAAHGRLPKDSGMQLTPAGKVKIKEDKSTMTYFITANPQEDAAKWMSSVMTKPPQVRTKRRTSFKQSNLPSNVA